MSTADVNLHSAQAQTAAGHEGDTTHETIPNQLGKYVIKRKIGEGGMGTVYLAVDPQLKRTVALKILPTEKSRNKTLVRRFQSEAQSAAQLTHENIVRVYDAGESAGHLYIAFEYVEGTDVHQLLSKRGRLSVRRAIEIVKQVAKALEHAHSRSIVHRDIKPSNLLIRRDGTVKVTDLGLARSIDENSEAGITRAGMTVGTVDYMAPEQARDSKAADIRSDIYSLGCTFYQLLTGEPPYTNNSLTSKLHAHATQTIPNPRLKNETVPEGVLAVIQRMMAKKPEDRYQTPTDLLNDLELQGLQRAQVQNNILAELAADEPASTTPKRTSQQSVPKTAPPRRLNAQQIDQDDKLVHFDSLQVVKSIVLIGVIIGVLWWLSTLFSTASNTFTIPNAPRPDHLDEVEPNPADHHNQDDSNQVPAINLNTSSRKQDDHIMQLKVDVPLVPLVAPKPKVKKPPDQNPPAKKPTRRKPDF